MRRGTQAFLRRTLAAGNPAATIAPWYILHLSRRSSRSILSRLALKAAILPCCLLAVALAHSAEEAELLVLKDGRQVLGVVSDADADHYRVLMQFQGLELGEMIIAKARINERRVPSAEELKPSMVWQVAEGDNSGGRH